MRNLVDDGSSRSIDEVDGSFGGGRGDGGDGKEVRVEVCDEDEVRERRRVRTREDNAKGRRFETRLTLVESTSISENSAERRDRILRRRFDAVDGLFLGEGKSPDLGKRRVRRNPEGFENLLSPFESGSSDDEVRRFDGKEKSREEVDLKSRGRRGQVE